MVKLFRNFSNPAIFFFEYIKLSSQGRNYLQHLGLLSAREELPVNSPNKYASVEKSSQGRSW